MYFVISEPILPDILRKLHSKPNGSIDSHQDTNTSQVGYFAIYILQDAGDYGLARDVGILNGAKPLTQVLLNPLFGMLIDR